MMRPTDARLILLSATAALFNDILAFHHKLSPSSATRTGALFAKGFGKPKATDSKEEPKYGAEAAAALPEERKQVLFQSLLRDLQIENVPLLECDATSVETYQGAVWTTMAGMADQAGPSKACLVLEQIPMSALKAFADDIATLKLQPRLLDELPEMARFSVEVIGKGVGPALVLEVVQDDTIYNKDHDNEEQATAALKAFVERVVIQEAACPYTKNVDMAPAGLQAKGVTPATVGYRYNGSTNMCHIMAAFWTNICELQSFPQSELSTIVLSLPGVDTHDRFAAVMEYLSRNLCLFRGDALFGLVHFHPEYDRDAIFPQDKPAYGHLPPRSWLRPMMKLNGSDRTLTDDELELSDYQRRSPHTAINILRTSQIAAAAGGNSIVDLELDDGTTVKASGISTYSRNAIRLAEIGKEALQAALAKEQAML